MSSRSIPKSALSVFIGAVLACMCSLAFIVPQKAHADELQAASLTTQSVDLTAQANKNLTTAKAKKIKLGSSVTVKFDRDDMVGTNFKNANYWFSYRHGKRDAVYSIEVDSVDGVECGAFVYDNNERMLKQKNISSGEPFFTWFDTTYDSSNKNKNYYIRVATGHSWYGNSWPEQINDGDAFKVTVKEHPVIKQVSGLKASKKAKTALSLKWNKVTGATKYKVAYKKVGAEKWKYKTVKSTKVTLKKLKKNTQYEVHVQAFRKGGWNTVDEQAANWGPWSNSKTYKTKK